MNIKCIETGFLKENCYILEKDSKYLIIDPGEDFSLIKSKISGDVVGVLITHRHFDHIGALESVVKEYRPLIYEKINLEEKVYHIDPFSFKVIFTPGHSKDSVTYHFFEENIMFTGDFLFYNDIGRCDLEGGSFTEMKKSIEKIKKYDDNTKIYPGHGESTTLGLEKEKNIYFND